MRFLSEGRSRVEGIPWGIAFMLSGVGWLAVVGAVVTVRALVEWMT